MNQMPISECYLPKCNIQPHYHKLIVRMYIYIHEVRYSLRMVFQTQVLISLVIVVIGIQDLYISKYKYTIMPIIVIITFECPLGPQALGPLAESNTSCYTCMVLLLSWVKIRQFYE